MYNFDIVKQITSRIDNLINIGHSDIDKLEVIILGGTFQSYDKSIQEEFLNNSGAKSAEKPAPITVYFPATTG